MRIISGLAKGKKLSTFSGEDIRPTPDRVRGAIFSIIYSKLGGLVGKTVLDLFAGTGAMGIEALSRGASSLVSIDKGKQSAKLVPKNLKDCNLEKGATFLNIDVLASLARVAEKGPFDLILLDPPYDLGMALNALEKISTLDLLSEDGLICAETSHKEKLPESFGTLEKVDERTYGSTRVHFYKHT